MYIYCICCDGEIKTNFIKIGICKKIEKLKKRYNTYYGSSNKYYYIKVENLSYEKVIHERLKKMGLHIENELFIYNSVYNFDFYIQQLNNLESYNIKDDKQEETVFKNMINNLTDKKIVDFKTENSFINKYKEKTINIPKKDIIIKPLSLFIYIKYIFKEIKKDIEKNNILNIIKIYNIIENKIINQINTYDFWKFIIGAKTCNFIHKTGNNKGEICGRSVFIKANDDLYNGRCSRHINSKYYNVASVIIDFSNRCICKNKYREQCKLSKKYGNFCVNHYKKENNLKSINIKNYLLLENEILLLNNIEY